MNNRIKDYKNFFLIGIGGIGMSALARYFNSIGKRIAGYDRNSSVITDALIAEGCEISFEDSKNKIPKSGLNFIADTSLEKNFLLLCGFERFKEFFVRIDILEKLFLKILEICLIFFVFDI